MRLLKIAVVTIVLTLVALYGLVLVGMFVVQDGMMFPAPDQSREELDAFAEQNGLVPFEVTTADGVRLYGMHRPAGGRQALIFHHGNGGSIFAITAFAEYLPDVDIVAFSYRGYPGSDPVQPDEDGLITDARAVFGHVTDTLGIPPDRIVVQGQSLGGGVVHGLLEHVTPRAVVLDSTFTSAVDVASDQFPYLPVRWLFRHEFPSARRAPNVRVPVQIFHGTADKLIGFHHAETLHELLPDSRLHPVPERGHEHWLLAQPGVLPVYQAFVREQLGLP